MSEPIEIPGTDPALHDALADAGLPTEDLTEPGRKFFRYDDSTGATIGYVGWEASDGQALLRSLVVLPQRRGEGWGRALAAWALKRMAETGITDVYMLTGTAEGLALALGFSRIDRADAPPAIRDSRQFTILCPAETALLHRRINYLAQPA